MYKPLIPLITAGLDHSCLLPGFPEYLLQMELKTLANLLCTSINIHWKSRFFLALHGSLDARIPLHSSVSPCIPLSSFPALLGPALLISSIFSDQAVLPISCGCSNITQAKDEGIVYWFSPGMVSLEQPGLWNVSLPMEWDDLYGPNPNHSGILLNNPIK